MQAHHNLTMRGYGGHYKYRFVQSDDMWSGRDWRLMRIDCKGNLSRALELEDRWVRGKAALFADNDCTVRVEAPKE